MNAWPFAVFSGPRATSPGVPEPAGNVVIFWNEATLDAIRKTHPGPPMVARMLAIVQTCIYDAWAAYDAIATGTRLGGFLRRPAGERTEENKAKAISFAAYGALSDLFPQPERLAHFQELMRSRGYDPGDKSTDSSATGIGNQVANAVLAFRHGDGSNQLGDLAPGAYADYTGYQPLNTPDEVREPNRWQPLRVGSNVQKFIAPHWGLVTPFALAAGSQFRRQLQIMHPSGEFTKQCQDQLDISAALTDEQKVIAEYWADGPNSELPPGHWCLFAKIVSMRDKHGVDEAAKMFFALANAVFDASIACWDAKRTFDSVRPVSAIHYVFAGKRVRAWAGPEKGTQEIDGKDWIPYQPLSVVTPPFAEFTSGHSTFSAAAAEILKRFTHSDEFDHSVTVRAGSSAVEPDKVPASDVTLKWPTFTAAADEAGISRRYGGIHFEDGDLFARAMGRQVGREVWEKALTYFTGA